MLLEEILEEAIRRDASDINITSEEQISYRIKKDLHIVNEFHGFISQYAIQDIAMKISNNNGIIIDLYTPMEKDGSYAYIYDNHTYYFRYNIALSVSRIHITIRKLIDRVYTVEEMGLDKGEGARFLESAISMKEGMNIIVGATGSGKSTSLATLLDQQLVLGNNKIVSLEAPVEYFFSSNKYKEYNSIIIQREVELDTKTFADGIRAAMRQNPDVIFIGEIRDKETALAALQAANSGHVVMTTLHAKSAELGIDRIKFLVGETTNDWSFVNAIMFQKLVKENGIVVPERHTLIGEEIYGKM